MTAPSMVQLEFMGAILYSPSPRAVNARTTISQLKKRASIFMAILAPACSTNKPTAILIPAKASATILYCRKS